MELNASLRHLTEKLVPQPTGGTGPIKFVNYSTRHIRVTLRGYGIIRSVRVQEGIQLGTTDRPVVNAGDLAEIKQRAGDHQWICTAIHSKVHCASQTFGISPDVEIENSLETANSYIVQELGSLETPLDLRLPPIESLGQLTLPEFRNLDLNPYDIGDGINTSISGTTEMLYFVTSRTWYIRAVNLYTTATDITLTVELDGTPIIVSTRTGGSWDTNGEGGGSSDLELHTLDTAITVFGPGSIFRTFIDGSADLFGYGLGGNI